MAAWKKWTRIVMNASNPRSGQSSCNFPTYIFSPAQFSQGLKRDLTRRVSFTRLVVTPSNTANNYFSRYVPNYPYRFMMRTIPNIPFPKDPGISLFSLIFPSGNFICLYGYSVNNSIAIEIILTNPFIIYLYQHQNRNAVKFLILTLNPCLRTGKKR
jgi:hypothetical protein